MNRECKLSWAAGFFDGEGSVYIRHTTKHKGGNGRYYPLLTVEMSLSQVEPHPLRRFKKIVNTGKLGGPYKPRKKNAKPYYKWQTAGRPSTRKVLLLLWPYLSNPKKIQAKRCWKELLEKRTKKSPKLQELPR